MSYGMNNKTESDGSTNGLPPFPVLLFFKTFKINLTNLSNVRDLSKSKREVIIFCAVHNVVRRPKFLHHGIAARNPALPRTLPVGRFVYAC